MPITWIATPQDVERPIAAVLPHASTDKYLPAINNVRIELDGERFLAVATDRYSLGICRASLTDWMEDAQPVESTAAHLLLDDVKRLFAFLRPQRKDVATWELGNGTLTVTLGDGTSLTIRTAEADNFPKWRGLFGQLTERTPEPAEHMAFTPLVIDHFQKTAQVLGGVSVNWQFVSQLKPVIVRIGADFLGILMPCRPADTPQLSLDAFGIESPKAVAA
jgi:hypothetical protein